jgi:hypothetical protein
MTLLCIDDLLMDTEQENEKFKGNAAVGLPSSPRLNVLLYRLLGMASHV